MPPLAQFTNGVDTQKSTAPNYQNLLAYGDLSFRVYRVCHLSFEGIQSAMHGPRRQDSHLD